MMSTIEGWLKVRAQIIYKNLRLCSTIEFMRKFGVFVLSLVLFISLLSLALSTSSNIALTHPAKIKSWLNQSNLYGNFVADAIKQAQKSTGSDASGISLNDAAVQQIAHSTFSSQLLQNDVDSFVDSNYAWLEGKSSSPNFRIELTDAKQAFAVKVGDYVETYLKNLNVCSDAQTSELSTQNPDPLTLPCRPVGMIPSTVAAQVTDEIANSDTFLSDPVITASNIDPKADGENQPYYQNLSGLPSVYQLGTKLPIIAGVIALASAIGVVLIPKRHRNGWKVLAGVLAFSGVVLVITKFASTLAFDQIQKAVFNEKGVGQLQKSLTTFLHLAQNQLVKIDLLFGVAYLALALLIVIFIYVSRQRQLTPAFLRNEQRPPRQPQAPVDASPRPVAPEIPQPGPTHPGQASATAPTLPAKKPAAKGSAATTPRRRKPPKLIQ